MARYFYRVANLQGIDDCAVNALCLTVGGTWVDNYRALCKCGEITFSMPNSKRAIDRYMTAHHYPKMMTSFCKGLTVGKFADAYSSGVYYILCANHATAVIDGVIYDAIDPSRRKVEAAYLIKGE